MGDTAHFGGAVRAYGWRVRATLTSGTTWVFMWLLYEAGEPAWFLGKYVAEDLSEATCSGMTAESEAPNGEWRGPCQPGRPISSVLPQPAEDEGADCEGMRSMIDSACGVLELLIQVQVAKYK